MTLRSAAEDSEYLPAYGLLIVRDHYESGRFDGPDDAVDGLDALEESDTAEYPFGTVAEAGVAWLRARAASNEYHRVRLEAHDLVPADDAEYWAQVMESPYFCRSGGIFLSMVTGSDADTVLALGVGLYRVRVSCRIAPRVAPPSVRGTVPSTWVEIRPVPSPELLGRTGGRAFGQPAQ